MTETLSFGERLINNTLGCYYVAGVIALILTVVTVCALIGGYSLITVFAAMVLLPLWMQGVVIIVMIPFIVAVVKTICETYIEASNYGYCKSEPIFKKASFTVDISRRTDNTSRVCLWARPYGSTKPDCESDIIAISSPCNDDANAVAKHYLDNAIDIYNNYMSKPYGRNITSMPDNPLPNTTTLKEQIASLEQKVKELQKSDKIKTSSLPPLSGLERMNKESNE